MKHSFYRGVAALGMSLCLLSSTVLAAPVCTDIPEDHWGAEAMTFALDNDLMRPTSDGVFSPDAPMSRLMLLNALATMDGEEIPVEGKDAIWVRIGLKWGVTNGITDGQNYESTATREQMATMLYRYAMEERLTNYGDDRVLVTFADADDVSPWAREAMAWVTDVGILDGVGGNCLAPQSQTTRAQAAVALMRFAELLHWGS